MYRSMNLKSKLDNISEDEQLALISADGMVIKRPVVVTDNTVLVGFNTDKWAVLKD